MPEEEKDWNEMSFSEALANTAADKKDTIIFALMEAVKKGEPSAVKVVTNAILEHQYNEENKFPIGDDKFKELILLLAGAIQNGEI